MENLDDNSNWVHIHLLMRKFFFSFLFCPHPEPLQFTMLLTSNCPCKVRVP
jgi:hypothetical protein